MKNKHFIIVLLLNVLISHLTSAQIVLVVAKDKDHSAIDFKVEWGYTYHYEAKDAAQKYMANKGYTTVSDQPCEECGDSIKEGVYVVIKTTYQTYDKKTRVSYGMGASRSSAQEAEQRAVKNLGIYDWTWKKSNGYQVVETNNFKNSDAHKFIYIVEKAKDNTCGDYAVKYKVLASEMSSTVYAKMKSGIKDNSVARNLPSPDMGCFRISKRYVAVLKCLKTCNSKEIAFYKFVEANDASELKAIAPMQKDEVFNGSGYSYFVEEMIEVQSVSESMLDSFINFVNPLLKGLNLIKNNGSFSIGTRG
jgi:hypothetical protein